MKKGESYIFAISIIMYCIWTYYLYHVKHHLNEQSNHEVSMCTCSHLYIYWNKTYLFHPISHLAILFCDMRWRIVMCLGVFALFLLACDSWSAESEVSEPVLWMRTASAVYHFSPFLFADPLVFSPKGWLSHGVVLFGEFIVAYVTMEVQVSTKSRWGWM
jgi:hypothetical protein